MAHPQIAAFARLAEGGAKPTRAIAGQNTLITRTIHDMAYDPVRDEIVVPQFFAFAILTFRGDATGDVAPVRKIFGPRTQLQNPQALALDSLHGEIFVPQEDTILVFPRDADGDVAPIRVLKGPDTQLGVSRVVIDPIHNLMIASGPAPGGGGHLLIFNRTDAGNTKPRAVIQGPKTMLVGTALMAVYPPRGHIVASVRSGTYSVDLGQSASSRSSPKNFVGVWSINDQGDVPPLWTIGGPNGILTQVRGVTLNPKNQEVIISDKNLNAVLTFHFPEIF